MSLIAIALVCMFVLQFLCYWLTYRVVKRLLLALKGRILAQIMTSVMFAVAVLFLSLSSVVMMLSMRYVQLIFITCGLALIVLVTTANFVSEGGGE